MVQIPRQDAPSVNPISASGGNYQRLDTNPDMFGAAMGRALVEVGQGLDSVGNAFGRIAASAEAGQKEKDTATVNNAFTNALVDTGAVDAEYLSTEGQAAAEGLTAYTAKVQAIQQKYLDTLPPALRADFSTQFSRAAAYRIIEGQKHAAAGLKDMTVDSATGAIESIYNDAAVMAQDDNLNAENLAKLDKHVDTLASAHGWSPEKAASERRAYHSGAWAVRIQQIALNDPPAAMKMLNENRDQITAKDLPGVENTVHSMLMNRQANVTIDRALNGGDPATEPNTVGAIVRSGLPSYFTPRDVELARGVSGDLLKVTNRAAQLLEAKGIRVTIGDMGGRRDIATQRQLKAQGYSKTLNSRHLYGIALDLWPAGVNKDDVNSVPTATWDAIHGAMRQASAELGIPLDKDISWDRPHFQLPWSAKGRGVVAERGMPGAGSGASLVNRVIGAESGGRGGLVSPAGALGLMQVMPETGRMVANQLGIPFSAERLRHDNAYNMQIGKAYLGMLLNRYGGNQALAVAAYNAGPGRVDRWIKTIGDPRSGAISDAQWAAAIPIDETRNYTTKIIGASGPGAGPGPVITANSTLADRAEAEKRVSAFGLQDTGGVYDSDYDALLRSGVRARWNDLKQEADAQYAGVYGQVSEAAFGPEPGKGPKSTAELLTTDDLKQAWAQLSNKDRATIGKILESNSAPAVEMTNEGLNVYNNLKGQSLVDPEAFAAIPTADIIGNEKLPMGTKKELIDLQQSIKNGKKTEPDGSNVAHDMEVLRLPLIAAGIDPSPTTAEEATRLYTLVGALSAAKQDWMKTHDGKPPTDDEVRKIGSDLLRKTPVAGSWFTPYSSRGPTFGGTSEEFNFETLGVAHDNLDVTFNAVPPPAPFLDTGERAQIVAAYKQKFGGKEPSEETINAYALRRRFLEKQKQPK